MSLLASVASVLERAGIPFALIGAGALAVHGVSRSTLDQDLLVTDRRVLTPDMWSALNDVSVDIRAGDPEDPLAGVVRFVAAGQRDVDLVVGRHEWQRAVLNRAQHVWTGDLTIPVAAISDLILLKLYAGGAQDLWDVEQLLGVAEAGVAEQVERELTNLPQRCAELWRARRR